jgi:signal peptidase
VGKETQNDITLFTTEGDANGTPDGTQITSSDILGKVVIKIPFLGYVVAFTRTVPGLIILVVIPAVIIIYEEINKIKVEVKKRKEKRKAS